MLVAETVIVLEVNDLVVGAELIANVEVIGAELIASVERAANVTGAGSSVEYEGWVCVDDRMQCVEVEPAAREC